MATNDSELTPRDPDWQRQHCEAHGMRLLRTEDDTTGGFTVTVTLSNELRLENQTKNKNNTLISNAPKYLADPQWRQYSQAAIAAEKRYIKKTTISAITKERDEKIKKLLLPRRADRTGEHEQDGGLGRPSRRPQGRSSTTRSSGAAVSPSRSATATSWACATAERS